MLPAHYLESLAQKEKITGKLMLEEACEGANERCVCLLRHLWGSQSS